jgi:hypothetical protein
MSRLELVPLHDRVVDPPPAVFYEAAAAKYVRMSRTKFRKDVVFAGLISYAEHVNGKARIYLRSDLDNYLKSLNWRKMVPREVSPVAPKGVAE